MQNRTLRGVVVRTGAVLAAAGALFVGCNDDSTSTRELRNVNVTIPINAAAAANGTTELLEGQTFTGLSGSTLAANTVPANTSMVGQSVTIKFTTVSGANANFDLTTPNVTASGTVKFASCEFTVVTTSDATKLPVGAKITISNCSVHYDSNNVPVGETTGTAGTVTLVINGVTSSPLNTTVEIQDNGILVVTTASGATVVTTVLITGSSGG
jgi:hypothetical protein